MPFAMVDVMPNSAASSASLRVRDLVGLSFSRLQASEFSCQSIAKALSKPSQLAGAVPLHPRSIAKALFKLSQLAGAVPLHPRSIAKALFKPSQLAGAVPLHRQRATDLSQFSRLARVSGLSQVHRRFLQRSRCRHMARATFHAVHFFG
jgi:hypothetical protein